MKTYVIDPQHSIVEFAVKHMKVSTVKGRFLGLQGTLHIDDASPGNSWVEVVINANTVDTGLPERDEHLRSPDFLNTRLYPEIRFRSTNTERISSGTWQISGTLTLRGISKPIRLDAEFEGRMVDFQGIERIGFSAQARFNRRDFGMNWNGWMDRFIVDDDVRISINVEAKSQ